MVNVKDQDAYTKQFLPKVMAAIKENGGEYLAGGMNKTTSFAGEQPPNRVVIIKFPSIEAFKKFEDGETVRSCARKSALSPLTGKACGPSKARKRNNKEEARRAAQAVRLLSSPWLPHGSGVTKTSCGKLANCSLLSTAGSLRALTRAI
jgi:uncharacterized protein (DUF1330 family)